MAISFLCEKICRPQPKRSECPINKICKIVQIKIAKLSGDNEKIDMKFMIAEIYRVVIAI
jgi:adenine-specific DNA glycosylase